MTRLLIIILLLLCSHLSSFAQNNLNDIKWLLGTWEISSNKFESWTWKSDSMLLGRSYTVNETDTMVLETIRLLIRNDQFYYIVTVMNQNKGEPIIFKLNRGDPQNLTFENSEHDFPQKIHYVKDGDNKISVWIEGEIRGKLKKSEFNLKRTAATFTEKIIEQN